MFGVILSIFTNDVIFFASKTTHIIYVNSFTPINFSHLFKRSDHRCYVRLLYAITYVKVKMCFQMLSQYGPRYLVLYLLTLVFCQLVIYSYLTGPDLKLTLTTRKFALLLSINFFVYSFPSFIILTDLTDFD